NPGQRSTIRRLRLSCDQEMQAFKNAANHDAVYVGPAEPTFLRRVIAIHQYDAVNLKWHAVDDLAASRQKPRRADVVKGRGRDPLFEIKCLDGFCAHGR